MNSSIKKLLHIGLMMFISSFSQAALVGKLDLNSANFEAITIRELHDGMWLVGAQKTIWELDDNISGVEVLHVSGFWCSRLEGNDTAYGPSVGMPLGTIGTALVNGLSTIANVVPGAGQLTDLWTMPPWLKKVDSLISVDIYGGYRPTTSLDDHHWIYGFGGKVQIPMDQLFGWAKGSNGQKGL